MRSFGKFLVTRHAAATLLRSVVIDELPVLDFTGVEVVNHAFADELGKGIVARLPHEDLRSVKWENGNPYIDRCVAAGFATAELDKNGIDM